MIQHKPVKLGYYRFGRRFLISVAFKEINILVQCLCCTPYVVTNNRCFLPDFTPVITNLVECVIYVFLIHLFLPYFEFLNGVKT